MEHKPIAIIILPVFVAGILMLGILAATGNAQESSNTGTTPATAASGADQQAILAIHNSERAAVGTPDLAWSDSLAAGAASYLDEMLKQNEAAGSGWAAWPPVTFDNLRHDPAKPSNIGENLAFSASASSSGGEAASVEKLVGQWVRESHQPLATNHYTQMVWKDTKEVGCATAVAKGTTTSGLPAVGTYLNCRYTPRGNTIGVPAY
jgi:uncharacterized protein YkwD